MRRTAIFLALFALAGLLAAQVASAADRKVIEVSWADLRQRLAGSSGKTFRVVLLDGREFRASLLRIEGDGVVVASSSAASEWAVAPGQSKIPRSELAALQQTGRQGRGRLIGTLAGAGLMAVAVAYPGKRIDTIDDKRFSRGEAAAAGALFVGMGYLIGFGVDKPYPELRPLP